MRVTTVLLWVGAELTKRIGWVLPYAAAVGVLMVIAGFTHELWKQRAPKPKDLASKAQ